MLIAVLAIAAGIYAFVKRPTPPQISAELAVPLTIEPFGDGFSLNATQDVDAAIKVIRDSNYFTYFTDKEGNKIPIVDQYKLRILDFSKSPDWAEMDMNVTFRKVTTQSGEVKLVPFGDGKADAASQQLVSLKIRGKMLRITPKYAWDIDPNFFRTPPGVLQDIYLATDAKVEASSMRTVHANAVGKYESVGAYGKIESETAAALSRSYKNAILGTWETSIPEGLVKKAEVCEIPYATGQQIDVREGGDSFPFRILDAGENSVTFTFADQEYRDVPVNGYRLYGEYAALCLKGFSEGPTRRLRVQFCTLDGKKLAKLGVVAKFRNPAPMSPTRPRVVFMDSHLPDTVYAPETARAGGSNADDIIRYVKDLPVECIKEATSLEWDGEARVSAMKPDMIVIHLSCFYQETNVDDSDNKFHAFLKSMAGTNTKFLVYTRGLPQEPDDPVRERWKRFVAAVEDPTFAGRSVLFHVLGGENATFRDIPTVGALRAKMKEMLNLP